MSDFDEAMELVAKVRRFGSKPDRIRVHPSRVPMIIELIQCGMLPWKMTRDEDGTLVFDARRDGEEMSSFIECGDPAKKVAILGNFLAGPPNGPHIGVNVEYRGEAFDLLVRDLFMMPIGDATALGIVALVSPRRHRSRLVRAWRGGWRAVAGFALRRIVE